MAEEASNSTDTEQNASDVTEPHGTEGGGTDYKALYEQSQADFEKVKAESRKWEKNAKTNYQKAKEFDSIKQSQMTDQERIDALQAKVDGYERAESISKWKAEAAKKYDLPADLIQGSDEKQIDDHAKALKQYIAAIKKPKINVPGGNKNPDERNVKGDWLREAIQNSRH